MCNKARGILFSHLGNSHMNIYRCFCGNKVKNDSNLKKVAECCTKWKLSVIKIAESYFSFVKFSYEYLLLFLCKQCEQMMQISKWSQSVALNDY